MTFNVYSIDPQDTLNTSKPLNKRTTESGKEKTTRLMTVKKRGVLQKRHPVLFYVWKLYPWRSTSTCSRGCRTNEVLVESHDFEEVFLRVSPLYHKPTAFGLSSHFI